MAYSIYVDKNENFECEVLIKNASTKGSIARLIIESANGPNLVFNGRLEGDKCIIPIKRLKGILDENTRGKMNLEIIVEDTYFSPWSDDFIVEEHTSVKVKVDEQKQSSNKPIVQIKTHPITKCVGGLGKPMKSINRRGINIYTPHKEISMLCEQFGIKKQNLQRRRNDFIHILREYFKANPEYNYHRHTILYGIGDVLK